MSGTRRLRLVLAVLAALVVVALPVAPAAADHAPPPASHEPAGSGSFEGTELVEDQLFLGQPCFRVTRHLFGLRGVGTYEGRTVAGDPVVFRGQIDPQSGHTVWGEGPLRLQIENTGTFYHGPFGTHGTDSACSSATTGSPVPAQFRVFAAEGVQDTDGDLDVDVLTGAAWVYRLDAAGQKVPCVAQGTFACGTPGNRRPGAKGHPHVDVDTRSGTGRAKLHPRRDGASTSVVAWGVAAGGLTGDR